MDYGKHASVVRTFLDKKGLCYEETDFGRAMAFTGGINGFTGKGGEYDGYQYALLVDDNVVQSYAAMPESDVEKLSEMAEFVARANQGIQIGKFDLDCDDGEVRFHVALPVNALQNDAAHSMDLLLRGCLETLNRHAHAYKMVLKGEMTPSEAIGLAAQ